MMNWEKRTEVVTAEDLRQIYCPEYILDADNGIKVTEKQKDNPDALAEITFRYGGHIIYVTQHILDKSKDIYRSGPDGALCLRKICDGFILLDTPDAHYIIYLELKSGCSDVRKKAILQIPASYLKINSLLKGFSSFDKSQYRELALIVSYPPKPAAAGGGSDENPKVMAYKKKIVRHDGEDMIRDKYYNMLLSDGVAMFEGTDFHMDKLRNICPEMRFSRLCVIHKTVADGCRRAEVDLDEMVAKAAEMSVAGWTCRED